MADYFIRVKVIRLSPATADCSIIGLATDPDFSPTAVFDLRTRTTERRITRAIKNRGYKLQLPILPCDPLRSLAPIRFPFPSSRLSNEIQPCEHPLRNRIIKEREREREIQRVSIEYSKFIDRVGGKSNGRSVSRWTFNACTYTSCAKLESRSSYERKRYVWRVSISLHVFSADRCIFIYTA